MEALQETQLHKSEMIDSNEKLLNSADSHDVGSLLDFTMSFQQFGDLYLDKRLTSSLTDTLKYDYPTLVQSKAIPILLQRKDALIQARTGSGKTLAYAVPMIQHCLTTFPNNIPKPFFGCVLVPTRELATQVTCVFSSLCNFLNSFITIRNTSTHLHRLSCEESPTILISTPKAFLTYISNKQKQLGNDSKQEKRVKTFWRDKKTASLYNISSIFEKNIQCIVLDEADVLLGLGFKNDISSLFKDILKNSTPGNRQYQITLCSATLSPEVLELKSMVLYKPAIIQLKGADYNSFTNFSTGGLFEPQRNCSLCEFYFCCLPNEKYLVLYSLLKLSLLPMKCLIFVNSIQCAYTLLLLLRRFSIPSTVLCDSIPFSTRLRLLSSFQQGVYDILIAVDQLETKDCQQKGVSKETSISPLLGTPDIDDPSNSNSVIGSSNTTKKQKKNKENDFGVHRGVDFKGVRCVLNFDVPFTLTAYIHRIGRTARAGACGIALTLFQSTHDDEMHFLQSLQSSRCATLSTVSPLKPLELNMKNIECFRYRVADVLQSITPKTIASVRAYELQRDLLCSARLKEHFETNPEDMKALKNAFKSVQLTQQDDKHLKSIPSYFKSFVSHLQSSTAIESALLRLFESEQEGTHNSKKTFKGKRLERSSDIIKDLSTSTAGRKKRRSTHDILLKNLKKEPENYSTTPIDSLPILSNRMLKYQVKKKFTKTKKRSNRYT